MCLLPYIVIYLSYSIVYYSNTQDLVTVKQSRLVERLQKASIDANVNNWCIDVTDCQICHSQRVQRFGMQSANQIAYLAAGPQNSAEMLVGKAAQPLLKRCSARLSSGSRLPVSRALTGALISDNGPLIIFRLH